ncbi:MAG TPA: hypothetical protein VGA37_04275 [Gemmatimonadales bacterium]
MAKKMSAKGQEALATIEEGNRKVDRIHSLVEQYAAGGKGSESLPSMISRAATDVGRVFMNNGMGVLADNANQIAMLAKRGGATASKFRGLRELVGSLKGGLDRAEKGVYEAEKPDEGGEH